MRVRNGLYGVLGLALVVCLSASAGCETAKEYNYYSEVKGAGASTAEQTPVPEIMKQMRLANLRLVDSLTYMNLQAVQANAVQMYELAKVLTKTQPAVALQSPEDVGKYRKLADDLAETMLQVGAAARDNRPEVADWTYSQAFPLCNQCHMQFRAATPTKMSPLPPVIETPPSAPTTPPTGGTGTETPTAPAPEAAP